MKSFFAAVMPDPFTQTCVLQGHITALRARGKRSAARNGRWSDARRASGLSCARKSCRSSCGHAMIRSSGRIGMRAGKLGRVRAERLTARNSRRKGINPQSAPQTPFVEIAHDQGGAPIGCADMLRQQARLQHARRAQQPQMRRDQPQGLTVQPDIGHDRAPRLQPRQSHGFGLLHLCPAQQQQVSMPPMCSPAQAVGQRHGCQPRRAVQIVGVQNAAPVAEAAVNLLQRDDIGAQALRSHAPRGPGRAAYRSRPPCECCKSRRWSFMQPWHLPPLDLCEVMRRATIARVIERSVTGRQAHGAGG